jgi:hypothetical protein
MMTFISASILLDAVRKIRKCLTESGELIDTKKLWLHAVSFSLLLVATAINFYALILAGGHCKNYSYCLWTNLIALVSTDVSNIILVLILWELGTAAPEEESDHPETE